MKTEGIPPQKSSGQLLCFQTVKIFPPNYSKKLALSGIGLRQFKFSNGPEGIFFWATAENSRIFSGSDKVESFHQKFLTQG